MNKNQDLPAEFPLPVCEACSDNLRALLLAGSETKGQRPEGARQEAGRPAPDGPGPDVSQRPTGER